MTDLLPSTQRWLTPYGIRVQITAALAAGIDRDLVIDAVAQGLTGECRRVEPAGSPLSLSLQRAFDSSVGPTLGGAALAVPSAGPTEASASPAPSSLPGAEADPRDGTSASGAGEVSSSIDEGTPLHP